MHIFDKIPRKTSVCNRKHNLTGNSIYERCEFYLRHYGRTYILYSSFVILLCAIINILYSCTSYNLHCSHDLFRVVNATFEKYENNNNKIILLYNE